MDNLDNQTNFTRIIFIWCAEKDTMTLPTTENIVVEVKVDNKVQIDRFSTDWSLSLELHENWVTR